LLLAQEHFLLAQEHFLSSSFFLKKEKK